MWCEFIFCYVYPISRPEVDVISFPSSSPSFLIILNIINNTAAILIVIVVVDIISRDLKN